MSMYLHGQNGREEIERSCQCIYMVRTGGRRLKDHVNVRTNIHVYCAKAISPNKPEFLNISGLHSQK